MLALLLGSLNETIGGIMATRRIMIEEEGKEIIAVVSKRVRGLKNTDKSLQALAGQTVLVLPETFYPSCIGPGVLVKTKEEKVVPILLKHLLTKDGNAQLSVAKIFNKKGFRKKMALLYH